ncbi:MAG: hypothetical protein QXP53_00265 [Candidatus Pacearchaeota archaeon]
MKNLIANIEKLKEEYPLLISGYIYNLNKARINGMEPNHSAVLSEKIRGINDALKDGNNPSSKMCELVDELQEFINNYSSSKRITNNLKKIKDSIMYFF